MIEMNNGKKFYSEYEQGYQQGRADERERIIDMLKSKAWVKDEQAHLLFDSVLIPISIIIDEIEEEIMEDNNDGRDNKGND